VRHPPKGGGRSAAKRDGSGFVRNQGGSRGKNSPRRVDLLKGWRTAVGGEGQTGRRPLRRENARPLGEQPPGSRVRMMETSAGRKDERGRERRNAFPAAQWRESPRGRKPKRAVRSCPDLITRGYKGRGWPGRFKPLGRRCEADVVSQESVRTEWVGGNPGSIVGSEKGSEGRSP